MGDTLALYRRLVGAQIRASWQYRVSFLTITLGSTLATVLDLLAIVVIFERTTSLAGWSFDEVLLLFATATVPFGIADLFVSPVEDAWDHVRAGTFDRFLIRPAGALLQVCSDGFALRRVGRTVQPLAILAVAVGRVDVDWTVGRALWLAATIGCGTAIFGALWVLTASGAFWAAEAAEVANSFTYGGGFLSQYPLDVLSSSLRRVALIVPLAFVNYLPVTWLLGRPDAFGLPPWAPLLAPAVAAALSGAAALAWRAGIRHYRSTGS